MARPMPRPAPVMGILLVSRADTLVGFWCRAPVVQHLCRYFLFLFQLVNFIGLVQQHAVCRSPGQTVNNMSGFQDRCPAIRTT